ncbi:MAG: hypothetical protein H8E21_09420 [Gammaproteobacteria bacterium]|nr:hypothetical protein [Gammaproteobacteria bacterium]MBL6998325.1 hypothetical protein [Gammaproteobacteria bacterium]
MHTFKRRQFLQLSLGSSIGLMLPGLAHAANIQQLSGRVYINKKIARLDSLVRPGDLITTSHNGRIAFTIGADAFLLKERTSLQAGSRDNPVIDLLQLLTGKLLSVFGKGALRNIVTANATIGIRGTGCFLNVAPDSLYYCNCYGKTTLNSGHIHETFEATHHNAHQIDFEGGKMMGMQVMQVLDHSDDELRQLESYVGRIPLFDQT